MSSQDISPSQRGGQDGNVSQGKISEVLVRNRFLLLPPVLIQEEASSITYLIAVAESPITDLKVFARVADKCIRDFGGTAGTYEVGTYIRDASEFQLPRATIRTPYGTTHVILYPDSVIGEIYRNFLLTPHGSERRTPYPKQLDYKRLDLVLDARVLKAWKDGSLLQALLDKPYLGRTAY